MHNDNVVTRYYKWVTEDRLYRYTTHGTDLLMCFNIDWQKRSVNGITIIMYGVSPAASYGIYKHELIVID